MKKTIIAGNWKMNKTVAESLEFVRTFLQNFKLNNPTDTEIIIAPPFTAISKLHDHLKNSQIKLSGQNISWESSGAFTGEISASMLKEAGAKHVIIGHSERRHIFKETDAIINKKIIAALNNSITPIFCIGETLSEREDKKVESVIKSQITSGLTNLTANNIKNLIIAYEPVWAIGTGKTATKEQAEDTHLIIRKILAKIFDQETASSMSILYGGSVNPDNASELLSQPNIDGALIGGASLKPEDFLDIVNFSPNP